MPILTKQDPKSGRTWYEARLKVQGTVLSKCFKTYPDASEWINEQRFYRDQKVVTNHSQRVTIKMLFDAYIEFARQKNRAYGTIDKAETNFELYLKPFYGDKDVRLFSIEAHETFLGALKERGLDGQKGLKGATVNRIRALLSVMWNIAMRKRHHGGVIKENPFVYIEPIPEDAERETVQYWTEPEVQTFLNHASGTHYYPLWMTLLNTGMRIGEAAALSVSQIDTQCDAITIDRTWSKSLKAIQPKAKNGVHYAPVSDALKKVLYPQIKSKMGLVFLSPNGVPLNQEHLVKVVLPKLCREAGVKHVGLHGMRHTFATQFHLNGGEIEALSRILGHSSVQLTKKVYVHFTKLNVQRHSNVISVQSNVVTLPVRKENRREIVSRNGNVLNVNFRGVG